MCVCVCTLFSFHFLSLYSAHNLRFNPQPPLSNESLEPLVGVSVGVYAVQGVCVEPTVCQLQI